MNTLLFSMVIFVNTVVFYNNLFGSVVKNTFYKYLTRESIFHVVYITPYYSILWEIKKKKKTAEQIFKYVAFTRIFRNSLD